MRVSYRTQSKNTGLRVRKRKQNHDAIVTAALAAFAKDGYDAVTLDEIAASANVHRRTLLRYFPSKSYLVLGGPYRALSEFREAMRQRGARPVLDVWEEYVRLGTQLRLKDARNVDVSKLIESESSLRAEARSIDVEYQSIIASELSKDIRSEYPIDVICSLISGSLVGGQSALYRSLIESKSYERDSEKMFQLIALTRKILHELTIRA